MEGHGYTEGMEGHGYTEGKEGHGYTEGKWDMDVLRERMSCLYRGNEGTWL